MTRAHNFTRKQIAQLAARAAGKCELCGLPFKVKGEADHIKEVALGGLSTIENAQFICVPCHKEKSAKGIAAIRKADRQRDRQSGALKSARPLGQRKERPGIGTVDKWVGFVRPGWRTEE